MAGEIYNISRNMLDDDIDKESIFDLLEAVSMKMLDIVSYGVFINESKKSMVGNYDVSTNIMNLPITKQAYNNGLDFAVNMMKEFNILDLTGE